MSASKASEGRQPMGRWLPVAESASSQDLEINAFWECIPEEVITRVSVRGASTAAEARLAALRVLGAYGADLDAVRLTWEAGEQDDEQVAFVRRAAARRRRARLRWTCRGYMYFADVRESECLDVARSIWLLGSEYVSVTSWCATDADGPYGWRFVSPAPRRDFAEGGYSGR